MSNQYRSKTYWKHYRETRRNVRDDFNFIHTDSGNNENESDQLQPQERVFSDFSYRSSRHGPVADNDMVVKDRQPHRSSACRSSNDKDFLYNAHTESELDLGENVEMIVSDSVTGDRPTLVNNGFNEVENVDNEIDDDYLHEYDNVDMLSDSDEDVEDHSDLADDFCIWAAKFNISHSAIQDLLCI